MRCMSEEMKYLIAMNLTIRDEIAFMATSDCHPKDRVRLREMVKRDYDERFKLYLEGTNDYGKSNKGDPD